MLSNKDLTAHRESYFCSVGQFDTPPEICHSRFSYPQWVLTNFLESIHYDNNHIINSLLENSNNIIFISKNIDLLKLFFTKSKLGWFDLQK